MLEQNLIYCKHIETAPTFRLATQQAFVRV